MRSIILYILLATTLLMHSCRVRITPIEPPADPPRPAANACKAPTIDKNIIGTWKGGIILSVQYDTIPRSAPFTSATFTRLGAITFNADKTVVDPDSLFENRIDIGPIVKKTYEIKTDTIQYGGSYTGYKEYGELFWVHFYTKNTLNIRGDAGYYFKVITNECKRIHLKGPGGTYELVLIRP